MKVKTVTAAPPVPCRAHDRSTGADYDGLRLWGVPCIGQLLTLLRGGKSRTFRVEDVQHLAAADRRGHSAHQVQLFVRPAQDPIRHVTLPAQS